MRMEHEGFWSVLVTFYLAGFFGFLVVSWALAWCL